MMSVVVAIASVHRREPMTNKIAKMALVMMAILIFGVGVVSIPGGVVELRDFTAFYVGAVLVQEHPGQMYDPQLQAQTQERFTGIRIAPGVDFFPFAYPPVVAWVFAPFT